MLLIGINHLFLWAIYAMAMLNNQRVSEICGFSSQIFPNMRWNKATADQLAGNDSFWRSASTAEVLVLEFTHYCQHPKWLLTPFFWGDMVYLSDPAPRWIRKHLSHDQSRIFMEFLQELKGTGLLKKMVTVAAYCLTHPISSSYCGWRKSCTSW